MKCFSCGLADEIPILWESAYWVFDTQRGRETSLALVTSVAIFCEDCVEIIFPEQKIEFDIDEGIN